MRESPQCLADTNRDDFFRRSHALDQDGDLSPRGCRYPIDEGEFESRATLPQRNERLIGLGAVTPFCRIEVREFRNDDVRPVFRALEYDILAAASNMATAETRQHAR
jgi:hypothetical protein